MVARRAKRDRIRNITITTTKTRALKTISGAFLTKDSCSVRSLSSKNCLNAGPFKSRTEKVFPCCRRTPSQTVLSSDRRCSKPAIISRRSKYFLWRCEKVLIVVPRSEFSGSLSNLRRISFSADPVNSVLPTKVSARRYSMSRTRCCIVSAGILSKLSPAMTLTCS